jgi:hypothetical protein
VNLLGLQFGSAKLVTDSQAQQPLFASNAMPLLIVL